MKTLNKKLFSKLFPVADRPSLSERETLGLSKSALDAYHNHIRAKITGDYRPPLKGEWYISGSIPEAYKAPNDLLTDFCIAKLVRVKIETKTIIVEV